MKTLHTFLSKLETQASVQSCEVCGVREELIVHKIPGEAVSTAKEYLCAHCTMIAGCNTKR